MSVVPFIEGQRILEIGYGPGHLQHVLLSRNLVVVGIDESTQMGRLAQRNLKASLALHADKQANLTRGVAQHLPFADRSFDSVVATFPTEYITDPDTLAEVQRCLSDGGRFIVLPVSLPKNRFLDWLFKVTHQSPREALEVVKSRLKEPFLAAGFQTAVETLDVKSGILLIVLATNASR